MLEVRVRCLRNFKVQPGFLEFKRIIFQFCGMGEAIELGKTVQNLTK